MYVTTHDTAPRLHVKIQGSMRDQFSLSFGDALIRYGRDIQLEFLAGAYRRAGLSFGRLIEEHFVVLNERMRPMTPREKAGAGAGSGTLAGSALTGPAAGPSAGAGVSDAATGSGKGMDRRGMKRKWKIVKENNKEKRKLAKAAAKLKKVEKLSKKKSDVVITTAVVHTPAPVLAIPTE